MLSGKPWQDLAEDALPPCALERGGFMRDHDSFVTREHPYAGGWLPSHAHFAATQLRLRPYSVEATPFRWTMRNEAVEIAQRWGIDYDPALEEQVDALMSRPTPWLQDHRNQLALLDSFFSALQPQKSLIFLYAKDIPLIQDRKPGARVLVGAGLVTRVFHSTEWQYSRPGPLRSVEWERSVGHSIRAPGFSNGFLLPYQRLLGEKKLAGEDLSAYVAQTPEESFDEFSYVSELVGHDSALAALIELSRVVDLMREVAGGPWEQIRSWLSARIADTWSLRGPFPGLPSALTGAGFSRGALVAHRVLSGISDPEADPWPAIDEAFTNRGSGPAAELVGRMDSKNWAYLRAESDRFELLRLLARFSLTSAQVRRVLDRCDQDNALIPALLANPYLIYEQDRDVQDAVTFTTIDRGLFPQDPGAKTILLNAKLPDPVEESSDDRRIRAACTALLEQAADEGNTLLDEARLRARLKEMPLTPVCDPPGHVFTIAAGDFPPMLVETPLAHGKGRGWQLRRLAEAGDRISQEATRRLRRRPLEVEVDWHAHIDGVLGKKADPDDRDEQAGRVEKAQALRTLARGRISALVGPAGTGKTTMLKALCSLPMVTGRVLLLAPTGKARVQLGEKTGQQAKTLAQYLRAFGRWSEESGYRLNPDGRRDDTWYAAVVVDEASMLTEEMLAALLDTLTGAERLVLCGDHRQLPPIGAGRPFADLVRHLQDLGDQAAGKEAGGGLAELTVSRRQIVTQGLPQPSSNRDDLAVASWFSVEGANPVADEAVARVLAGRGDGSLTIRRWDTEEELHQAIVDCLQAELELTPGDEEALKRSLGASEYRGRMGFTFGKGGAGAENWQLLTPVRARLGGVAGLNSLIRRVWRHDQVARHLKSRFLPDPMGSDQILLHDKVMVVQNRRHRLTRVSDWAKLDGVVANGEIGMVVAGAGPKGKKPAGLNVELSTQPGLQVTFWKGELDPGEEGGDLLELAYAITVHKSQGSQFGITFVVVPNPCSLLSPELLYTALTRHQDRCMLLVQGDPAELRNVVGPARSDTARRLTRLFREPDPFETKDGQVVDGSHAHRTINGEMVRSKSEVIVANILRNLGVDYRYEETLTMPDGSWRSPDFTIRIPERPTIYWEHLGVLNKPDYASKWEDKRRWYAEHDILPWTQGGGPNGMLVWSTEQIELKGIDAQAIEALAREVFRTS
ncbi:AAA family ATPase [Microbispora rosea]|uniref:AAA family ATPase n=1 Tax=Microbispora rosea TaxID=58117 RepID=UPI00342C38E5